MLKNIDPSNKSIKPFEVNKTFRLTQNDSGSGHFVLKAISGSAYNFNTGSATSQSFGDYIPSASKFSMGTFYSLPTWHSINQLYYKRSSDPFGCFTSKSIPKTNRELNGTARVFTIPRNLFGEKVKPGSIKLDVTINGVTYDLRDDSDGNIYDFAHSASYAAFRSSSFSRKQGVQSNGSGSEVGNVIYEHGQIIITDTGSYSDAGTNTGHTLTYKASHTIYEHEYLVEIEPNEFNKTMNLSTCFERSGSISIAEGSVSMSNFFPPSDQPSGEGTGSYKTIYNATDKYEGFVTHSEFAPYMSSVGLYNDDGELCAVGKLAKPIKLNQDATTTVVVRFDV
tara:strand:+ start:27 stop:1040 length:1014 start_codon:yes stop_codon:yes gene_type:complete